MDSAFPSAAAQIPAAIETVRRFFDGINHETDTGDEAPAIATFTNECNLCGHEVFSIKSLLDGGHAIRGGHLHLLKVDGAYASYRQTVTVQVTETEDGGQQLDAQGTIVRSFDPVPPTKLVFNLEVDNGVARIFRLDRVGG